MKGGAVMFGIFFWVAMFLTLIGGVYVNRTNWAGGGWSLAMWVAVLLLGLRVYPFHG